MVLVAAVAGPRQVKLLQLRPFSTFVLAPSLAEGGEGKGGG